MKRLLALLLVVYGCSARQAHLEAPRAPLARAHDTEASAPARLAPLAGLGSGVRRIDAELR